MGNCQLRGSTRKELAVAPTNNVEQPAANSSTSADSPPQDSDEVVAVSSTSENQPNEEAPIETQPTPSTLMSFANRRARMTVTVSPEMDNKSQTVTSSEPTLDLQPGPSIKASEKSRLIDEQLVKDHRASERVVKMLLLGPSESGKSTVLKQMRIIHCNGFTEQELRTRRGLIFSNIVQSMSQLIHGLRLLGFRFTAQEEKDVNTVMQAWHDQSIVENSLPDHVYEAIKRLWSDEKTSEAYSRRSEFYLIDCAKYFLDDLDRIKAEDYIPTVTDILHSRQETIGVSEVRYRYKHLEFRIFDILRLHLFDNVNCLFFIAAISEYDQKMREDIEVNRLHDAMELFGSVANNTLFSKVQLILFLNKQDIFAEKIRRIPLTACFPNYKYKNDFKNAGLYITRKFEKLVRDKKEVYTHLTKPTPATGPLKPDEKISGDPKQKGYKPGHLPEFADPEEKDTDTFYGVKSALAFPVKNPDGTLQNNSPDVQSQQKIQKIADAKGPAPNTQAAAVPVNL
ncbi:hypothetical protein M3Y98_00116900 [Aphelenchoides besseyi]|nr:hypothetical protein M3Y98_00116900 [Aphelenchoides besseyi]